MHSTLDYYLLNMRSIVPMLPPFISYSCLDNDDKNDNGVFYPGPRLEVPPVGGDLRLIYRFATAAVHHGSKCRCWPAPTHRPGSDCRSLSITFRDLLKRW